MEGLKKLGRGIGAVIIGALFVGWLLLDMASCIYVNPCPGLIEDAERAIDRGDYDAAQKAVDEYERAGCPTDD